MTARATRRTRLSAAGIVALAGLACAEMAELPYQPQPIAVRFTNPRVMLDFEGDSLKTTRSDGAPGGEDWTRDWTPALGLRIEGSIYHEKFLEFSADTTQGYTWGERHIDDGEGREVSDDRRFTRRDYDGRATLLRDMAYPVTLFGSRRTEDRNYDDFNHYNADTSKYGASVRGENARWNWDLSGTHTREETDSNERPGLFHETLFDFDASQSRSRGSATTLRLSRQDFDRLDDGVPEYGGVQYTADATDEQTFGTNGQTRLLSTLHFNDLDEDLLTSQSLTVREDLRREHRDNLRSGAIYQYDRREEGGASFNSHSGETYVEHRLYQNLDSRLDLHGEHDEGVSDREDRYGPGLAEHYTRGLGGIGRVGLDLEGRYDRIERSSAGSELTVIGERLLLVDGRPALLAQRHVRPETIAVRDPGGSRRYISGVDYRVVGRGEYTEIQRVFGGAIPEGSTVLVDYVADAGGSDSLERAEHRTAFELDFFEERAVFYAEQRATDNMGDASPTYEEYRDTTFGTRSRWDWFEAGVEHTDHSADSLSYDGMAYYAQIIMERESASLRLRAGKSDLDYRGQQGYLDTRTYTATSEWRPFSRLRLQGFAGRYKEYTQDGERDLLTLEGRTLFEFARLTVDGTYRYEDEEIDPAQYERHYFLMKVIREL